MTSKQEMRTELISRFQNEQVTALTGYRKRINTLTDAQLESEYQRIVLGVVPADKINKKK